MEFQVNKDIKFKYNKQINQLLDKITIKKYYSTKSPEQISTLNDNDFNTNFSPINDKEELFLERKKTYIFDFGDHIVGRVKLNINFKGSPPDAPVKIKLQFGELLSEVLREPEEYSGELSASWIQEELLTIDIIPNEIELTRRYAFRYIKVKVIDTSPKFDISLDFNAISETSANISKITTVEIKDELLKKIDEISQKTLVQCMQDVFEDGPKRDRRLWLGDLRLQARANYFTVRNNELVKKCLLLFATKVAENGLVAANIFDKPYLIPDDTFLADYSLFFIDTLLEYFQETKDLETLKILYPVAKDQYMELKKVISSDGEVIPKNGWWAFIDWQEKLDKRLSIQGIYIYSLKKLISLAEFVKDYTIIEELIKQISLLEKWVIENAYDPQKSLFIHKEELQPSIASQVWISLAEVGDLEFQRNLLKSVLNNRENLIACNTPYMYHHLVEALFENDLTEEGIYELKDYWGGMVKMGADTFWEAFNPEDPAFSPYGDSLINSYCHAWSCTPCYLIRKYILNSK